MSPRSLFLLFSLFAVSCARTLPPPVSAEAQDILKAPSPVDEISARAHELLRSQQLALWKQWTEGTPSVLEKKYDALFEPSTLMILSSSTTHDVLTQRAQERLRLFLIGELLSRNLVQIQAEMDALELSSTFQVNEQEYSIGEVPGLLALEKSGYRRKQIYNESTAALGKWVEAAEKRKQLLSSSVTQAGFPRVSDYALALRETSTAQLQALADVFLKQSDDIYRQIIDEKALRELNLALPKVTRADLPRLFKSMEAEDLFPAAVHVNRTLQTLAKMGIDMSLIPNVRINVSDKANRGPSALTVAMSVPEDIRLSFKPQKGAREQAHLFHEMGHALQYAHTRPMRFELSQLGNVVPSETYAYLLEDLTVDAAWLTQFAGFDAANLGPYLRAASAQRLYRARFLAARLAYQLSLWTQSDVEPMKHHRKMTQHLKVSSLASDDARILMDQDELLESADTLRVLLYSAQLRQIPRQRFGVTYWNSPAAGQFLKELWQQGNSMSLEEWAKKFGSETIAPSAFLQEVEKGLATPLPVPASDGGIPDGGSL